MSALLMYNYCVRHFDSVDPDEFQNLHFAQHGLNTWLCSRELPRPLRLHPSENPVHNAPLIFQMTGTISINEPIITSRNSDHMPTKIVFWIEPRPNPAAKSLWRRIPRSVEGIATTTDLHYSTENLYKFDRAHMMGTLKLRCVWRSHVCIFFLAIYYHDLPIYPKQTEPDGSPSMPPIYINGYQGHIRSIRGFLHPVQVLFNLAHGPEDQNGEVELEASIITVATM